MRRAWIACALVGLSIASPSPAADPLPEKSAAPGATTPFLVTPSPSDLTEVPCCCMDCCEPCCCQCGPPGRVWLSMEYIAWEGSGEHLPPLVTSSPPGTPLASAGVLGTPGAATIFGNGNVNEEMRSGLRFDGGTWLDDCHHIGIEFGFFFPLDGGHDGFLAGGTGTAGSPIISRPFVDAVTGRSSAELVSFPGVVGGSVHVGTSSNVWGGNADGRYNLCCGCNYRIDALGGYQYLRLSDSVQINENLTVTAPASALPLGTNILVQDRFQTTNDFNGVNLGLAGEFRYCKLYLDVRGTIALGDVHQTINISGTTAVTEPGTATVVNFGGLLAQGTNIGTFHRDNFAVLPELGLRAGYQLTDNLRAFVGYDVMYLSTVTRPGDVIDLTVNRSQVPPGTLVGPARPAVLGGQSDYWLQAVSAGIEFRY